MTRRGAEWTDEELSELRAMAEKNSSAVRIAARIRRSVSSVQRRAAMLGVKLRTVREHRADIRRAEQIVSH